MSADVEVGYNRLPSFAYDVTDDAFDDVIKSLTVVVTETNRTPSPTANRNDDNDSDLYDTDLEDDVTGINTLNIADEDSASIAYNDICSRNSTIPQTTIRRGLQESEISIHNRCMGTRDMTSLAISLCQNRDVEKLDLGGNALEGPGAVYIRTALAVNPYVTVLDLSENNLGSTIEGSIAIADLLRYNKGLVRLNLAGNHFKDQDSPYLAAGIIANERLVELNLSRNEFGEVGGLHLGKAIAKNESLCRLDLSWNSIRRKGAVAICKGLQVNNTLTQINLAWNGFGYEGSLALAEFLRKNTPLVELDVSNNRINWQGAVFISRGLSKNKTLEVIKLDNNPLTTTGCMDIIESINSNECVLHTLGLKGIPVIGEFSLIVMMIQDRREFQVEHGGFVNSHDVIGQRIEKRVTPIQKIINYMKERELRPTELFRMLDKNVAKKMDDDEIIEQLQKTGFRLPKHEMEELVEYIHQADGRSTDPSLVNYQKMAGGLKDHIDKRRLEKIQEIEREEKLRKFHKKILTHDLDAATLAGPPSESSVIFPPIGPFSNVGANSVRTASRISKISFAGMVDRMADPDSDYDEEEEKRKFLAAHAMAMLVGKVGMMTTTTNDPDSFTAQSGGGTRKGKLMSMSTKLGAKSKPFGEAAVKKKRTKKKKKKPK